MACGAQSGRAQGKSAAIVFDANTGQVLHAQAAEEPRFPASLTKMMTLYLAFELIEQGRLSYATKIKMSQEAASAAPSKLDLEPGEQIALGDAIRALITKSANDVAVAIGEHISGSEAKFAQLMTDRARQIGMRHTTFRNASGLPNPGQVTTARDMITLGLRLHDDYPRHFALFTTRTFAYHGSTYRNHNNLLFNYPGTEGIKTGYTGASGFNVVVSVKREGRHVMAAVFGGGTAGARDAHVRAILNRTWARASKVRTRKVEPMLIAKAPAAPAPKLALRPAKPVQVAQAPAPLKPEPKSLAAPRLATPPPPAAKTAAPVPSTVTVAAVAPSPGSLSLSAAAENRPAPPAAPATIATASALAPLPIAEPSVRRVMVAPRPRHSPPAETTEESPAQAPAAAVTRPAPDVAVAPAVRATASDPPLDTGERAFRAPPALMEASSDIARGDLRAVPHRRWPGEAEPAPRHDAPLEATETAILKSGGSSGEAALAVASVAGPAPQAMAAASAIVPAIKPTLPPPAAVRVSDPAPAPPAVAPPAPIVRGAPPSTLEAQAANLQRGAPAIAVDRPLVRVAQATSTDARPAYRLNGPASAAAKPSTSVSEVPAGGFHIQVGAFATVAEAERHLAGIRQRAGAALAATTPLTLPVQKGNRQLFRARFAGLDANRAATACLELRRMQIDCFVMRAE